MVVGLAVIIPNGWVLIGVVEAEELPRCKFLCRHTNVSFEIKVTDGTKFEVWIENQEAAYIIREEMWEHKWATHKGWLEQNKEYEMFDPIRAMESALEPQSNIYVHPRRPVPDGLPKPYRGRK